MDFLKELTSATMFDMFKNGFEYDSGIKLDPENDELRLKRTIRFNKLLPYAEELDEEAQQIFAEIKANLGRAVMLREIRPGCYEATVRLCKYDFSLSSCFTYLFRNWGFIYICLMLGPWSNININ